MATLLDAWNGWTDMQRLSALSAGDIGDGFRLWLFARAMAFVPEEPEWDERQESLIQVASDVRLDPDGAYEIAPRSGGGSWRLHSGRTAMFMEHAWSHFRHDLPLLRDIRVIRFLDADDGQFRPTGYDIDHYVNLVRGWERTLNCEPAGVTVRVARHDRNTESQWHAVRKYLRGIRPERGVHVTVQLIGPHFDDSGAYPTRREIMHGESFMVGSLNGHVVHPDDESDHASHRRLLYANDVLLIQGRLHQDLVKYIGQPTYRSRILTYDMSLPQNSDGLLMLRSMASDPLQRGMMFVRFLRTLGYAVTAGWQATGLKNAMRQKAVVRAIYPDTQETDHAPWPSRFEVELRHVPEDKWSQPPVADEDDPTCGLVELIGFLGDDGDEFVRAFGLWTRELKRTVDMRYLRSTFIESLRDIDDERIASPFDPTEMATIIGTLSVTPDWPQLGGGGIEARMDRIAGRHDSRFMDVLLDTLDMVPERNMPISKWREFSEMLRRFSEYPYDRDFWALPQNLQFLERDCARFKEATRRRLGISIQDGVMLVHHVAVALASETLTGAAAGSSQVALTALDWPAKEAIKQAWNPSDAWDLYDIHRYSVQQREFDKRMAKLAGEGWPVRKGPLGSWILAEDDGCREYSLYMRGAWPYETVLGLERVYGEEERLRLCIERIKMIRAARGKERHD